jgi:hypothetical protein
VVRYDMRGPSGCGAAAGAEDLIAAGSAAGHLSMEGKEGGCCCDIDIVWDLQTGDSDARVLERYGTGVAEYQDLARGKRRWRQAYATLLFLTAQNDMEGIANLVDMGRARTG